jgi:hypothetical protein
MVLAGVLCVLAWARMPIDDVLDRQGTYRERRGTIKSTIDLWPNCTISYRLVEAQGCAEGLPAHLCIMQNMMTESEVVLARRTIQVASDELRRVTGCRAVEVPDAPAAEGVVLVISNSASCYVDTLGMRRGGYNTMNLGWCLRDEPAAKHELLHVLGLEHEHQSPQSVDMLNRCSPGTCVPNSWNCDARSEAEHPNATEYDPSSIMHYPLHLSYGCELSLTDPKGFQALQEFGMTENAVGRVDNISSRDAASIRERYSSSPVEYADDNNDNSGKNSSGSGSSNVVIIVVASSAGALLVLIGGVLLVKSNRSSARNANNAPLLLDF